MALSFRRQAITQLITKAYRCYFDWKIGHQDKTWALHNFCNTWTDHLKSWWINLKGHSTPFFVAVIWREPTCLNINSIIAVSYTHLDVYKRQVIGPTGTLTSLQPLTYCVVKCHIVQEVTLLMNSMDSTVRIRTESVSYTHLDVYKRQ